MQGDGRVSLLYSQNDFNEYIQFSNIPYLHQDSLSEIEEEAIMNKCMEVQVNITSMLRKRDNIENVFMYCLKTKNCCLLEFLSSKLFRYLNLAKPIVLKVQ